MYDINKIKSLKPNTIFVKEENILYIKNEFIKYFNKEPTKEEIEFYYKLYNKSPNIAGKVFKYIKKLPYQDFDNLCSYSQCSQDLFVYNVFYKSKKTRGFYIEMGAGNGVYISNTKLLDNKGWTGLLIEPSNAYDELIINRKNDICVNALISDKEENLNFIEIHDKGQSSSLNNTLLSKVLIDDDDNDDIDNWAKNKVDIYGTIKEIKNLKTTTMESVLDKNNCPKIIDYFSLDVEGMEYKVLKNFPFEKYQINLLGIEHPTSPKLIKLLEKYFTLIKIVGDDYFYIIKMF